ncbi:MAG: tRNA lysidine(34) synthetase TilS [Actinobacteria bacterium]|nr:tRNA lysidine(34) synthetase TilS [Actinomycetota bacterium]
MSEKIEKQVFSSKLSKNRLVKDVEKTIDRFRMLEEKDRVLVSLSGGPDSTFLTYLLDYLRPRFNLTLFAFHLDHMTRGGQSAKDALFVEKLCQSLGIELTTERINVKEWCRQRKLTFQEGARSLRIQMLEEVSGKYKATKIATGHNADDNVETFLMHLIRGTGVKGLCGILPKAGKFIRPLIYTFRKDIISFLEKNNIPYCVDRTNLESIYFRNKIRNLLIPEIERSFSRAFKKNVLKVIEVIREENSLLDEFSKSKFDEIAFTGEDVELAGETSVEKLANSGKIGLVKIPLKELQRLPLALRRRLLLLGIEKVKGNLENVSFKNIEDIERICAAKTGGETRVIDIAGRVKVLKDSCYLGIVNVADLAKAIGISENVHPLGQLGVYLNNYEKEHGKGFSTETQREIIVVGESAEKSELVDERFGIKVSSRVMDIEEEKLSFEGMSSKEAFLDYHKIKFPVKIRSWKKGDRFFPLGLKGEKKLHDFFVDCKVPRYLRQKIPIFVDGEKIIWIGKYRIDERVKIDSNTKKILYLRIEEI